MYNVRYPGVVYLMCGTLVWYIYCAVPWCGIYNVRYQCGIYNVRYPGVVYIMCGTSVVYIMCGTLVWYV